MSYSGGAGSSRISTASDAALSNPATSQVLVYNATTQKWVNSVVPGINNKLDATAASTLYASINSPTFTGTPTVNGVSLGGGSTYSAAAGATTTLTNVTNSSVNIITLGRNTTFVFPSAAIGSQFTLLLAQDATGSRTVTWPSSVVFSGGTAPTITSIANRTDVLHFINVNGTTWIGYVDALNLAVGAGSTGGGTSTGSQFTVTAAPGDGQVLISWATTSTITGLSGWLVGRNGTDASGGGPWSTTDSSATTSRTFLSLNNGSIYTFSVAPVVNGTAGTAVTIQATPTVGGSGGSSNPATPTLAASVVNGVEQATLSWTVNGGTFTGLTGWSVGRDGTDAGGGGPWSTTVSSATSSQTFLTLTGGSTYNLFVAPVINGTVGTAVTIAAHPTASGTVVTTPGGGTSSASGVAMPTGNISGWTQVLAQDFNTNCALGQFGSVYPGWNGYDGNTSGFSGVTWNSATTMYVHDGVLDFHQYMSNGTPQCGALTPLVPNTGGWYQQSQLYGKYSVRYKIDPNQNGFKVAWLLWPSSNNWNQGEIDFPEGTFGQGLTYSSHNVVGNPSDQIYGYAGSTQTSDGNWHTATTTWQPGSVTYDLDGTTVGTITNANYLPTNPMRWDLQVETLGTNPSAGTSGHLYIDWLVQYSRN